LPNFSFSGSKALPRISKRIFTPRIVISISLFAIVSGVRCHQVFFGSCLLSRHNLARERAQKVETPCNSFTRWHASGFGLWAPNVKLPLTPSCHSFLLAISRSAAMLIVTLFVYCCRRRLIAAVTLCAIHLNSIKVRATRRRSVVAKKQRAN